MTRRYFGTDGIRGRVGEPPITPEFVLKLGYAAGRVLARGGSTPAVLVGKDTRISGYMLESALEAGLSAAGVDTLLVGPMPTAAVAFLTRALRLSAGIMVSASHNPFADNGFKFFSGDGFKLPDAIEAEVEVQLDAAMHCAAPASLGKARRVHDAEGRYIEFCKSTFPKRLSLRGLRLVLDCAHGAAYRVAPRVFEELGAEVLTVGAQPNGTNINEGVGATNTQALAEAVRSFGADVGVALDGDADRVAMCASGGRIYEGDVLLYVIAEDRLRRGALNGGVVGTLMTNMALEKHLAQRAVPFLRAKVGDRYVLESLRAHGWGLGGESSGHIICLDSHTTGDGIVSALQVLAASVEQQRPLAELAGALPLYAQCMVNLPVPRGFRLPAEGPVARAIQEGERALSGAGRLLVRPSGTEPLVRVMAEAEDKHMAQSIAERVAEVIASNVTHR